MLVGAIANGPALPEELLPSTNRGVLALARAVTWFDREVLDSWVRGAGPTVSVVASLILSCAELGL